MGVSIHNGMYVANEDGTIVSLFTNKTLKPGMTSRGYLSVSLYDGIVPKKTKSFLVHRLIAEAFLGKSELFVNHKNGIKTDNRIENLEYVTALENNRHSIEVLGKGLIGERNGRSRITAQDVVEIRSSDEPDQQLAARLGITMKHLADIKRKKYWKHL